MTSTQVQTSPHGPRHPTVRASMCKEAKGSHGSKRGLQSSQMGPRPSLRICLSCSLYFVEIYISITCTRCLARSSFARLRSNTASTVCPALAGGFLASTAPSDSIMSWPVSAKHLKWTESSGQAIQESRASGWETRHPGNGAGLWHRTPSSKP